MTATMTQPAQIEWDWDDPASAGQAKAGNWKDFKCFLWTPSRYEQPEDWCIYYTHNRDSGLLDQSNATTMRKRLIRHIRQGTIVEERHSHWACGWVEGFVIRVWKKNGKPTKAWIDFCELRRKLEDYPILDESHYSEMEYESALVGIECSASDTGILVDRDQLPEDWKSQCYQWLSEHHDNELENGSDDQGAYPDQDVMKDCLKALGLAELEEGEEPPPPPPLEIEGQLNLEFPGETRP